MLHPFDEDFASHCERNCGDQAGEGRLLKDEQDEGDEACGR